MKKPIKARAILSAVWKLALQFRIFEILQISFIGVFGLVAFDLPNQHFPVYLLALFSHVASVYYLNDFVDWNSDRRNPRKIQHGKRTPLLWLSLGLTFISLGSAFHVSRWHFGVFLLCTALGSLYSLQPFFLKGRRGWPLVVHFVSGFLYSASGVLLSTPELGLSGILLSGFWGICLAAGSLLNEIVDDVPDREAGIRTLGNTWSRRTGFWFLCLLHVTGLGIFFGLCLREVKMVPALGTLVGLGFYCWSMKGERTFLEIRKYVRVIFSTITLIYLLETLRGSF